MKAEPPELDFHVDLPDFLQNWPEAEGELVDPDNAETLNQSHADFEEGSSNDPASSRPSLTLDDLDRRVRDLQERFLTYAGSDERVHRQCRDLQDRLEAVEAECAQLRETVQQLASGASGATCQNGAGGQEISGSSRPNRAAYTTGTSAPFQIARYLEVPFGPASSQPGFWGALGDKDGDGSSKQKIHEVRSSLGTMMLRASQTAATSREFFDIMDYVARTLSSQIADTAQMLASRKWGQSGPTGSTSSANCHGTAPSKQVSSAPG